MKKKYLPVIGLEIHVELATESKMFCACPADHFGKPPNTQTCPTCLGLPGALPVANRKAIEWTVTAGLAFGCEIPLFSKFDRKNYFYPDLPKGYQISQYDLPFAVKGKLGLESQASGFKDKKVIRIRRIHLEEDTGKLIHQGESTLIDFNRSGVPLMELVTEPDIHSAEDAKIFLKRIQLMIRYLGISDCDMEKGSLRIEPNVSVLALSDSQALNFQKKQDFKSETISLPKYKVEVKNINSFRFAERAINYEIQRQTRILEEGKTPLQETRGWDEVKNVTFSQRVKEEAMDYRYFPEPDLPPIEWTEKQIAALRSRLPELPDRIIARWVEEFSLLNRQAELLSRSKESIEYFEKAVRLGKASRVKPKTIANVIINWPSTEKRPPLNALVKKIVAQESKPAFSDQELGKIILKVIEDNPKQAAEYKAGKKAVIEFFVGRVMKEGRGKLDAETARQKLKKALV